jgi:hypothetical protein
MADSTEKLLPPRGGLQSHDLNFGDIVLQNRPGLLYSSQIVCHLLKLTRYGAILINFD